MRDGVESNQRLEFLGDAVVDLIVSKYLTHRYPEKGEGFMTIARSLMVNNGELAQAAKRAGLDKKLLLGKGAEKDGSRFQPKVLADCFEAYVAAIYLRDGEVCAERFVMAHVDRSLPEQVNV
jgi:ribonuclease-3